METNGFVYREKILLQWCIILQNSIGMDIKTDWLQQEEAKEASRSLVLAFQESPNNMAIF